MEVLDPSHNAGEPIKATGDPMIIDKPAEEKPLTNGHEFATLPSDSAETHSTAPNEITNGVNKNVPPPSIQDQQPPPVVNGISVATSDEIKTGITLGSSESTGDSHLPEATLVSEAVTIKPLSPALEPTPVIVQAPTSDLREEAQPVDPERAAEIKEQKQSEDLRDEPASTNGLTAPTNAPILTPDVPSVSEVTISSVHAEPLAPVESVPEPAMAVETMTVESSVPEKTASVNLAELSHHPPVPVPEGSALEAPLEPAPTPIAQHDGAAPEAAPEAPTKVTSIDQPMEDAPPATTKIAREREEDDDGDGPSAKRAKTDDETSTAADFKIPEQPASSGDASVPEATHTAEDSTPMTKPQQKHLLKTIGNVKRITAAKMFTAPVDYVAMNLPNYPSMITKPMDLRTLEENIRADKYKTADAAVADFNQIVENSRIFNGPEHPVTNSALVMKQSFDKAMEKLPGPEITEVTATDRKKKAIEPGPVKIPPPRRESRSSLPGTARSPASAGSPQTFALSPEGVPLIRRDSTIDGRPKREIHRPAPRDLPYSNQKPKKKKYQWELKFCERVLNELSKARYQALSFPFMAPVDPVALNIPTYHNIVKKPMDFGTMKQKLDRGEYENAKDFESDARLVFQNCYKFNPPGDVIHNTGKDFEKVFDAEWAKKKEWVEDNTPASGPQSPGSSPEPDESEEEDEEEEEEEEEDPNESELMKLQQHIAALSKQVELIQKKKKSPPAPSKKSTKSKPVKKESKKSAPAAPVKAEKKAAPKPKKEKIPRVTYEQKQDISLRINNLSETKMATALKIIRDNMPNLQGVNDDELELDIDELSNDVLHKLLLFVRKHAPRADDSPAPPAKAPTASSSSAAPARKKNKPMSKHEQEARIAQVQSSLSAYKQGSPPAHASSHPGEDADASDGESDSEESSEEE